MASTESRYGGRKEFGKLSELLGKEEMTLLDRHRAGELVEKLIPTTERNYGDNAVVELAKELGLTASASILTQLRSLARVYGRDEVRKLQTPARGQSFVFTWAHAVRLMSLRQPERSRLERECRAGEWSTTELNRRIRARHRPRRKGGAPPKRPANVIDALIQVQMEGERFLKRSDQVWVGGKEPAITPEAIVEAGAEAQQVVTETVEVLDHMERAIAKLRAAFAGAASGRRTRRRTSRK